MLAVGNGEGKPNTEENGGKLLKNYGAPTAVVRLLLLMMINVVTD